MKVKIYIMHSDKIDYKEELYKPLLEAGLMNGFFLVLPLSNRFSSVYVKELIEDCDLILCDLSKANFFLNIELKWATKLNKEIYYFINKTDKNIKKFNHLKLNFYENKDDFIKSVQTLLQSLNKKEIILRRDNIYCLGKVEKIEKFN